MSHDDIRTRIREVQRLHNAATHVCQAQALADDLALDVERLLDAEDNATQALDAAISDGENVDPAAPPVTLDDAVRLIVDEVKRLRRVSTVRFPFVEAGESHTVAQHVVSVETRAHANPQIQMTLDRLDSDDSSRGRPRGSQRPRGRRPSPVAARGARRCPPVAVP